MSGQEFWRRIKKLYGPYGQQQPRTTQPTVRPPVVPATPPAAPIPSQQQQAPQPTRPQMGALDLQSKIELIHEAGRARKMLEITYDGMTRLVEPYSFRHGINGLLFYGHCSVHDRIHSFIPEKITSIRISEFGFQPRWEVEL